MTAPRGTGTREQGFTLVELLVSIAILGVVSVVLTEAVIVGLKTTDATANRVSGSVTMQALSSYFSGDAQSAVDVATSDSTCATDPVLIRLSWTDLGIDRTVSYSLDPGSGGTQELVRWSCSGPGTPDRKILGTFAHDPAAPQPVQAFIGTKSCSDPAAAPELINLSVSTDDKSTPACLTVKRRTQ